MKHSSEHLEELTLLTSTRTVNLATISPKHLGGEIAPKLAYFVLEKELLNFSEMHPWFVENGNQAYILEAVCILIDIL